MTNTLAHYITHLLRLQKFHMTAPLVIALKSFSSSCRQLKYWLYL